jgi:hypothetical protein
VIHAVDLKDRKVVAADAKDIKPAGKNCVRVVSGFFLKTFRKILFLNHLPQIISLLCLFDKIVFFGKELFQKLIFNFIF